MSCHCMSKLIEGACLELCHAGVLVVVCDLGKVPSLQVVVG